MADAKREKILKQILVSLGTVSGLVGVHRNRGDIEPINAETKNPNCPCGILLDGKWRIAVPTTGKGIGSIMPATTFLMFPQICIVLMPRDTPDNEGVGEELSLYEDRITKAILQDDSLISLCGNNGEIMYLGGETDMHTDGSLIGIMQLEFSFGYVFNPRAL